MQEPETVKIAQAQHMAQAEPQAYKGLFTSGRSFNPSLHSVGASPFLYEHLGPATRRPWEAPPAADGGRRESFVPEEDVQPHGQPHGQPQGTLPGAKPVHAVQTSQSPALEKENLKNDRPASRAPVQKEEEGEWWDFLPKLSMCAISQLGCCAGSDGARAISRRKELCGVGIVFTEANHGALIVQQVVPRSPAEACGKVKSGDELLSIDGKHVYRMNADMITPLVLGEEGTELTMTFLRRKAVLQPSDKGEKVQVVLKRRYFLSPQPPV